MKRTHPQKLSPRETVTAALSALLFLSLSSESAAATDWDFAVGAATVTQPIYAGADQSFAVPIPVFSATTRRGAWSISASVLDGFDVTWMNLERGLIAGLNVNQGQERRREVYSVFGMEQDHDADTMRLLEGAPEVSNPVNMTMSLGHLSAIGLLRLSLGYHPATVDLDTSESRRHALMLGLSHIASKSFGPRWSVTTIAQIQFMDSEYADAWYTAEETNSVHGTFDADAGLHDMMVAAQVSYAVNERVRVQWLAAHSRLVGDAGSSPYTTGRGQNTAYVQVEYAF